MRVHDTLAVLMLQSRLRLMEMSRHYPQIPSRLFSQDPNVSVCLEPDVEARGFDAVNAYYHSLLARSDTAGGYLRGDLATTPYICVAPDGKTAWASYLTFGPHVSEEEPRQVTFCFGRYTAECCVERGVWRIAKLHWTPVLTTVPTPLKPEENHALSTTNQQLWLQPPPQLHELRTTDAPESKCAQDTLEIENAFGLFLQRGAAGDQTFMDFFAPDATVRICDAAPQPASTLAAQAGKWLCLGTSRVIWPEGDKATCTWAAMAAEITDGEICPRWGRWSVEMERQDGRWVCTDLRWYTVAALEPWERGTYAPAACCMENAPMCAPCGDAAAPAAGASALCDDLLALENRMGQYMYILGTGRWDLVPPLFSDDPEVSTQISPTRIVNVGKPSLLDATFGKMERDFPDYDSFHTGGQIGVPLIEVCDDRAWGCFPSFGFLVIGRVFGLPDPPHTLSAAFGMWSHEFKRENGDWKFFHFQAPTLFEQRSWKWDPRHSNDLASQGKIKSMPVPPGLQ